MSDQTSKSSVPGTFYLPSSSPGVCSRSFSQSTPSPPPAPTSCSQSPTISRGLPALTTPNSGPSHEREPHKKRQLEANSYPGRELIAKVGDEVKLGSGY